MVTRSEADTLTRYLDQFLMVPDQVLVVAEDASLLMQLDTAFFEVGEANLGLLIKVYNPRAIARSTLQAGLRRRGLDVDGLEASGRLRWCPETSLESGVAALQRLLSEEGAAERTIWASFNWPHVDDVADKLRQQETLAALIATHPQLVVMTGVIEPEPEALPSLQEQWQLLGSLRGMIRFSRAGVLLSRVMASPTS
jgi:hypothetical protein